MTEVAEAHRRTMFESSTCKSWNVYKDLLYVLARASRAVHRLLAESRLLLTDRPLSKMLGQAFLAATWLLRFTNAGNCHSVPARFEFGALLLVTAQAVNVFVAY